MLKNRETYLSSLKSLFEQLLGEKKLQSFHIYQDFYCIYLPVGVENLSETDDDYKAILDFFPPESYSYQYYLDLGFMDSSNSEFDWREYRELISWNQKCLNFLSKILSLVVTNDLLSDQEMNNWLIRLIYYPPVDSPTYLRLAEHIDDDLLTIVISEDSSSLEIKDEDGKFKKIYVPPNSLLLLAGNCLEYITKGKIKGISHRVLGGDLYMNPRYIFSFHLGANLDRVSIRNYYEDILKNKYFLKLSESK